jgi:uncharacterized protein YndB with AHSA1/START domain
MKTVIKAIIFAIVTMIVVVVGGAYLIPPVAQVERAIVINAPPEKIYAIVGNLRRFNEWSPWADIDSTTEYSFEGPEQGAGQKMLWASNDPNVGKGSQSVVEAVANERVVTELDFGPMGKSTSTMTLKPVNDGTAVTWTFRADVNGIAERWMSLMFPKWIGADYGKGLAKLKLLAEKEQAGG